MLGTEPVSVNERGPLEATEAGVELIVVKRPEATKGFILRISVTSG